MRNFTAAKNALHVAIVVALFMLGGEIKPGLAADEIAFNTDVLDVQDRENVDLSQFSQEGYIMPGKYSMAIRINRSNLSEREIAFFADPENPKATIPCLTPELVKHFGLKSKEFKQLKWQDDNRCLVMGSLPGLTSRGDLANAALTIGIPQAWLEYSAEDWDPPSTWDDGIPGLLLDYNLNLQTQKNKGSGSRYDASATGTVGANFDAWRLRGNWQTQNSHETGTNNTRRSFDWTRIYLYRAIRSLGARLILGEDYLDSSLFDSIRFTGASLHTDDNMLPPNLRGYAPEVTGVAHTNAKVTISQQGRVLYETRVAAGPFRIQDLSDAVRGELNVRVEESDGTVQTFTVNTASIPYLTRPGLVRYKAAMGKPTNFKHQSNGPAFATGEFSWGVSNGWSLFGGYLGGGKYNALSLGIGRDLLILGALSLDVTQSRAQLPHQDKTLTGGSYRISYSKNFDRIDSQITFAGYRFSQENFMSMAEYLDARNDASRLGKSKQMYTITFNKNFTELGLSSYLTYLKQSFWDRADNERYSVMLSKYFDLWGMRNISLSLSAYRNKYDNITDDGMYLALSVPWGDRASIGYSLSQEKNNTSQSLSLNDRLNDRDNYQLRVGHSRQGADTSGNFTHDGDIASLNANASYRENSYTSLGLSAQGGMTLSTKGSALHRTGMQGGTRLLLDTDGVADVPVRGFGIPVNTNMSGKAVVTDVSDYYRTSARIDLDKLGSDAEALTSVVETTLTEGAIGYRRFNVISGSKAMAFITLKDGSHPPFGARVLNPRQQETGLVNDGGSVYLSGIKAGSTMTVNWDGKAQCEISLPPSLPADLMSTPLLLPCQVLHAGPL